MSEGRDPAPAGKRRFRDRPVYLTAILFVLLIVSPALEGRTLATLVLTVLFTLMLVGAALSVFGNYRVLTAVVAVGLPWMALNWTSAFVDLPAPIEIARAALAVAFTFFVAALMLTRILTDEKVTGNTLCRAVSTYVMMGLGWAAVYRLISIVDPDAFRPASLGAGWGHCVYFSFTVLTTLGLGDIAPAHPYARSFVIVEAIVGPLYLAILVARLVAMHGRDRAAGSSRDGD